MKILVIDAYNMIHRARFGWGKGDHAITFNFFRSIKSEIDRHEPDKIYIVSEGHPKHRFEINKDYKGQRAPVDDKGFHRQKKEIFNLCEYFPFTVIKHPDYECDDVIGYLCKKYQDDNLVTVVSSDSDFIQLLDNKNVSLWNPVKKKFVEPWPVDYVTWKSLKGDPTDNIPGIKGIGEKRAFALCENEQTLEDFFASDESRRKTFENAMKQIRLASIDENCDQWVVSHNCFDEKYTKNAFTNFEFSSIIGKSWDKWKNTMERLNVNT